MKRCPMCGKRFTRHLKTDEMCKSCGHQAEQDHIEIEKLMEAGHTHHCACRIVWGDGECECEKRGIIQGRISMAIEHMMGHHDCHMDSPGGPLDRGDITVEEAEKGHAFDEMWGVRGK